MNIDSMLCIVIINMTIVIDVVARQRCGMTDID